MENYASYIDSEVGWIGEIPSHWTMVNLSVLGKPRKNKNEGNRETNVLSLSYGRIKMRVLDNTGLLPESFETYNIIEPGDIVLRLTDLQNDQVSLRVGRTTERGVITSAYTTLEPIEAESRYLFYLLASFDYWKGFYGLAGGVRQSLNFEGIRALKYPLPPLDEQIAIADYLDDKLEYIDKSTEEIQQSIELLQEYRRSVISEAVTHGLDPNVPLKDSGIDWIGEVPANWELSKVKYSMENMDALRVPIEASLRKQSNGGLYPYYGASGVVDYIDEFILDGCYILVGEDGANLRLRNLPLVYTTSGKCWVNNHSHILLSGNSLLFEFAAYQLELVDLENYLTGTTMPKLTQSNLGNIPLVIPPLPEQRIIVETLTHELDDIDSLIESKRRQVELLKEYRRSLISEAATGKFKVPGLE